MATVRAAFATVSAMLTPAHRAKLESFRDFIPKRDQAIIAAYRDGATMREISEALGLISHSGVDEVLKRHGVAKRPRGHQTR